ncbi:nucleoside-diphosphate sugar epimerase/dehydratase [Ferrovum sp.]|uniref:polysaccharide biosynthesis protein n=1 Tax=Ferrovum sp. TaxID=2609467 RepID=UPI00260F3591|nr:nucleoside-diphosphate sugar epimerase/dehydratase [Ferrovum sp.]
MPFQKAIHPVLSLPRLTKRLLVLVVDACLCVLTVWLAYYLRLGEWVFLSGPPLWAAITSVALALPVFIAFGLYRAIFRYSGWPALMAVTRASFVYGLMFAALFTAIEVPGIPRTVGLMQPLLLLLAVGASRAMARFWLGGEYQNLLKHDTLPRVLVYGAGTSGRQLAGALAHSHEMRVVGFLDDDRLLQGNVLDGHRIYAPGDLPALKETLQISDVLLAIPSLNRHQRNEILELMRRSRVSVRTLPRMADLAQGRVSISALRELDLEDLLGREPVAPNHILLRKNIHHKVVLVTGAGGSIGSELCRQIAGLDPAVLLLVEQSEFALYELHQELLSRAPAFKLVPLLASVQDSHRMHEILSTWSPHTVYHAAAYKHVPMVEHNPAEGLKNNVLGTLTTALAALENGVPDFVLISTDKAVRPTNVMGTSKRLAEMVLQALAVESSVTRFSMVRFGNVLGSSGSVVPLFRQQIKEGGPITLTHGEVTRYFMTIPEAAQLVIQAGAMARGGDVFVLDMGEPVRIMDLARRMVELSGLRVRDSEDPEGDIEIQVTGLRPGEKLYEELLIGNQPEPTAHPRIMKAREDFLGWSELNGKLDSLTVALNSNDVDLIRSLLRQLVPGYQPEGDIVDWVHLEQKAEGPDG